MSRYHYLGERVPVGATLRYFASSARHPDQVLAGLGWKFAAWQIAVRDRWIGWTNARRGPVFRSRVRTMGYFSPIS